MPRLSSDQFSIVETHAPGHRADIVARDHTGKAVAGAQLTWPYHGPSTFVYPVEGASPYHGDEAQGHFAGHTFGAGRPKVSYAGVDTKAGAPRGIAHEMLAAAAQRHGVIPYADDNLTEQVSAMSRSAARRGLVVPHPDNPDMTPNVGMLAHWGESPHDDHNPGEGVVNDVVNSASFTRKTFFGTTEHTYTDDERHNARLKVGRARSQRPAALQGDQLKLL